MIKLICGICGKEYEKSAGHYNRAMKLGAPVYCGKICAGLGRRNNKTIEQKKAEKSQYDKEYRAKNVAVIDKKKKDYYEANKPAILEKMKDYRKKIMPRHVEYCRQPKYREYKKHYDKQYRAKKMFGELWESAIILTDLEREYDNREAFRDNKLYNKSTTKRKRQWRN